METDQFDDGSIPYNIPHYRDKKLGGSAGWGDAVTIIPWNYYVNYGDTGILRTMYPAMKKWVAYIRDNSENNLWTKSEHLGDWLAYNPDKPSRDILYKMGINCIITEKAEGTLLLGDKTLQAKNSAFTQLGIRFLFIHLRNIISESAKYSLFEMNDQYTRSAFVNRIDPFLRQIKGLRGVDDYFILCDERNNTAKVIQDGYFIGDIFIKPQYSIQWVKLNFSAINRNVSFEEVVANASGV